MKNMKRILTMCLALVMVLSCIPFANAAMPSEAVIDESAECSLTNQVFGSGDLSVL